MRYWTRGAFKFPVRITQKFWDELVERRKWFDGQSNDEKEGERVFCRVDTSSGTGGDDFWEVLGPRPKYPQWMVDYVEPVFMSLGLLGWCLILGFILSEIIKK